MPGSRPKSFAESATSFPTPLDNQNEDANTVVSSRFSDAGDAESARPPSSLAPAAVGAREQSQPRPVTRTDGTSLSPSRGANPPQTPSSSYQARYPPPPIPTSPSTDAGVSSISRPSTAGSRSHAPSLTPRAFFAPMSSQRLQAHRGQRPSSTAGQPRRDSEESEEDDDGRSRTIMDSTGSALGAGKNKNRRVRPPEAPRNLKRSQNQPGNEPRSNVPTVHSTASYLNEDGRPSRNAQSVETLDSSVGNGKTPEESPRLEPETAFAANKSPALEPKRGSRSHRMSESSKQFFQNFKPPSKQEHGSPRANGHEKLHSRDSNTQDLEKGSGKNWEYFDGNTIFLFGGRIQTAKDKPIMVVTAICIIVPAALFFYFSAPWLWSHVSPAIPIIFAYLFAVCMSSFFHASFSDPGVSFTFPMLKR